MKNIMAKKKEKNFNLLKEEKLTNFEFKINYNNIDKNLFYTNYPYSIKNFSAIKIDNQGSFWNNIRARKECFLEYYKENEPFRCEEITEEEMKIKSIYKSKKQYDDIYQFRKYIKVGKNHICHFQIRKNILQKKKYLIYNKKYSIEIYDMIKNKMQTLIKIGENLLYGFICFDVYMDDEQFLICLGDEKGNIHIFSVKQKDFLTCLESRNSNSPKFSQKLNLYASEKIINNNPQNKYFWN